MPFIDDRLSLHRKNKNNKRSRLRFFPVKWARKRKNVSLNEEQMTFTMKSFFRQKVLMMEKMMELSSQML